jgi:hypothetical protein
MRTFDRATDWIIGVLPTTVKYTMNDSREKGKVERDDEHMLFCSLITMGIKRVNAFPWA